MSDNKSAGFINLSNHPSSRWTAHQLDCAQEYGRVIDLPFPPIDPYCSSGEIDEIVDQYYQRIMTYRKPVVMLQGEYVFTYRLTCRLKAADIKVLAGCSERRTIEYTDNEGMTARRSEFEFVMFKEY